MRLLGIVQGTNPRGDVIVKSIAPENARVGDKVVDKRKKFLGTVRRVFGPVKSPYVSIAAKERGLSSGLVGIEVYIED